MLGRRVIVPCPEDDGGRVHDVAWRQRRATGKSHFDRLSGRLMNAVETGRKCRCVVRDHHIAVREMVDQLSAARVGDAAVRVDDQQFRRR